MDRESLPKILLPIESEVVIKTHLQFKYPDGNIKEVTLQSDMECIVSYIDGDSKKTIVGKYIDIHKVFKLYHSKNVNHLTLKPVNIDDACDLIFMVYQKNKNEHNFINININDIIDIMTYS